jgi:hypothetical protein
VRFAATTESTSLRALCVASLLPWIACLVHCQPAPLPVQRADEPARALADVTPLPDVMAATDGAVNDAEDRARPARRTPTRAPFRVERVAGLDADRLFAVVGEGLYRARAGRWEPIALDGGVARDVLVARGALWLLVEGRGANAGRALVFRSDDGDTLSLAFAASVSGRDAGSWTVRGFSAWGAGFFIAGASPALAHVDSQGTRVEHEGEGLSLQRVYSLQDDSIVATRDDGDLEVFRYGTRTAVVSDGILTGVRDGEGFGYVVHEDGAVWRGRPAKELRRVISAAPFEPRAAAMLRDGRMAIVGGGGPYAVSRGAGWQVVPGDWPSDPVAIVASDPPLVVGRAGAVVAVEGQGRTVVQPM